jgi:hypothetical protein
MDNFQFTRYLYEKDEVKISLLISLLNKSDESVFWAYELFYSGFRDELIEWIWIIYYDFYYVKNPSFEKYLSNKLNNVTDVLEDKLIATIISNLIIRPFSLDLFVLRKITLNETIVCEDNDICKNKLEVALCDKNYLKITSVILNKIDNKFCVEILKSIITFFINHHNLKIDEKKEIKEYKKNTKTNNKKIVLLSRIIHYFSILKNVKFGKKLYVHVDEEDIIMYETIESVLENNKFLPYKILSNACIYNIDSKNYLSLFHLKRDKYDIQLAYRDNWVYYASYSPLWKKRILKYNGVINNKERKITFLNEDDEELFYNEFGYEPDEQKLEVQQKVIQPIKKERNWVSFYEEHKNNCIIINDIIDIENTYLKNIDKYLI